MSTISDSEAHRLGLMTFREVRVGADGRTIDVVYSGGRSYRVPISYLISWYRAGPHDRVDSGSGLPADGANAEVSEDGDYVTVVLGNGSVYYVVWDVVLMACEPDYEHFGGFRKDTKLDTKEWFEKEGPFRLDNNETPDLRALSRKRDRHRT